MTNFSSKDIGFILVNGRNLLGSVTTVQDSVEAIIQEMTALGDSAARYKSTGINKGALSQSGFYDDAAGQVNEALRDNVGASDVFCYNVEGNVIGKTFVGYGGAIEAKYDRGVAIEKFHTANATYNPSGPIEDTGVILHAHGAEAAAGDTHASSVDNAASSRAVAIPILTSSVANPSVITTAVPHGLTSGDRAVFTGHVGSTPDLNGEHIATVLTPTTFTVPVNVTVGGAGGALVRANTTNGGSAYVQCSALVLGGFTNFAPKVQHSVDNSVWVDLGSAFTVITAAPAAERKVVAPGTLVNRYLASAWAFGGAGAGESVTFFVGFYRG